MTTLTVPSGDALAKILRKDAQQLEAQLGGRTKVLTALLTAPLTVEQEQVVALLGDPANEALSLADVCYMAGVSLPGFLRLIQDALLAKARLLSLRQVADQMPTVAGDVMELAQRSTQVCKRCKGLGTVTKRGKKEEDPTQEVCPSCDGDGTALYTPTLDRQRTALELGGLLDQKGGGVTVQVQQQQQTAILSPAGSLLALQRAVHQILTSGGPAQPPATASQPPAATSPPSDAPAPDRVVDGEEVSGP